jgi:Tol biopolymer transport system component
MTLVSTNGAGTDSANERSWGPVFGPDGRTLAFVSFASDLGPTDTHTSLDVYTRDLETD